MTEPTKTKKPDRPVPVGEASAVHATVYSNFMLVGETWYCTIECDKCGRVDEAIAWDTAKTPRHAALVAEERHAPCRADIDEEIEREARVREIEASRWLRDNQVANLRAARERVVVCEAVCAVDPGSRIKNAALAAAQANLAKHEKAMLEAEKRLANTIAENAPREASGA